MPERKKNRILGLVFLYLVAFSAAISGIIAYGYSEKSPQLSQNNAHEDITSYGTNDLPQKDTKLYSAPRDTLNLPIQIIVGNDALSRANTNDALREIQTVTSQNDTPTSTTSTPIATRSKGAPVTCASIDMCNKVTFNNGMSQQRKKQYLTSVFEIIGGIMAHMPTYKSLSSGIFSMNIRDEKGDRRGRGGSKTIQINTKDMQTQQEFKEVVTHELGHIVDLGIIIGTGGSLDTNYLLNNKPQFDITDSSLRFYNISWLDSTTRRNTARYTDFVGGYAMTSPYEDFAESWNMFLWHNTAFKVMAKESPQLAAKYQFFADIFGTFSFAKDVQNAKKVIGQPTRRPRDTSTISNP